MFEYIRIRKLPGEAVGPLDDRGDNPENLNELFVLVFASEDLALLAHAGTVSLGKDV